MRKIVILMLMFFMAFMFNDSITMASNNDSQFVIKPTMKHLKKHYSIIRQLPENINITFYNEDVSNFDKESIRQAKLDVKKNIQKHLRLLSSKGIKTNRIFKTHPLNIEVYPYYVSGYNGWYQKNEKAYTIPEVGEVYSTVDKIVVIMHFSDDGEFKSDTFEHDLIHEFGHYIEDNYVDYYDMVEFIKIRDMYNDEVIVNSIGDYYSGAPWEKRAGEIFSETYQELFLNKQNYIMPLKENERKLFEDFLLEEIK